MVPAARSSSALKSRLFRGSSETALADRAWPPVASCLGDSSRSVRAWLADSSITAAVSRGSCTGRGMAVVRPWYSTATVYWAGGSAAKVKLPSLAVMVVSRWVLESRRITAPAMGWRWSSRRMPVKGWAAAEAQERMAMATIGAGRWGSTCQDSAMCWPGWVAKFRLPRPLVRQGPPGVGRVGSPHGRPLRGGLLWRGWMDAGPHRDSDPRRSGRLVAYCGRAPDQDAPRYRFPAGFPKAQAR
jgi:hypothetical protein